MKLRLLNDPVLREPTSLVTQDELDHIKTLVPEMTVVMVNESGVGLSANQVGISKRFFIMRDGEDVKLIINPEIIEMTDIKPFEEGCLSIPGTSATTQRAHNLVLKYKDETWTDVQKTCTGFEAVIVQHEVDHLDGKLYTDALPPMRRMLVLDKHRKFMKLRGRMR